MPAPALLLRVTLFALCLASCSLSKPRPTPAPTATPALPQITILFPAHNQQVIEGVVFDIDILATDYKGIARIELLVDGEPTQTHEADSAQSELRVAMNWFAKGIGWHKFAAVAYREDGAASQPAVIALEVIASPAQ